MRRDAPMVIAVTILGVVLLAIAMILWNREGSRIGEIADLRAQLAAMEAAEPAEGGAETAEPPVQHVEVGTAWTWPIAESDYLVLTSPYGYRVSPILHVERYHEGIDVASTWRAQIVAAADGVVVEHWPAPDGYYRGHDVYGGMLMIEHADGWRTLYAHMSETRVHTGWTVQAGQVIGRVGSTGKSRGAHLHLELITPEGERVNPLLYVEPRSE